jgi:hypothetical protein
MSDNEPTRTFSLNSPEAYEILCGKPDPWLWGPCLGPGPRSWIPPVIIERG